MIFRVIEVALKVPKGALLLSDERGAKRVQTMLELLLRKPLILPG